MEIDKKIKADIAFLLELQKHKTEKTPNGGWDINLFKSSFVNKIKSLSKMGQQKSINAILEYLSTKNKELGLPPVFTANHNIWQYRTENKNEKELWEMPFVEFISKIQLSDNSSFGEKELIVSISRSGYVEEIGRIKNSNNEDTDDEYNRLQLEKIHQQEILKALREDKPVPTEVVNFYSTPKSLLFKNYGSTTVFREFPKYSLSTMNKKEKKYDLGYGSKGNGTAVWNRLDNNPITNDYRNIAHISDMGEITFYEKDLPENIIEEIKGFAETKKEPIISFTDREDDAVYTVEKDDKGIWTVYSEGKKWNRRNEFESGFESKDDAIKSAKLLSGNKKEVDPEHAFMLNELKQEMINPNTDDEFYDVIFSQIDAHDDWYGNTVKERYIKRQIAQLIKSEGQEPSENEVEEIFDVYKKRFIENNPSYEEDSNEIYYTTAPKSFDEFGTYTIEETNWYASNDNKFRKVSIPEKSLESQLNRYNSVGNFAIYRASVFDDVKEKIFTNKESKKEPEFKVGDIVFYESTDNLYNDKWLGIVKEVFEDKDGGYSYRVSALNTELSGNIVNKVNDKKEFLLKSDGSEDTEFKFFKMWDAYVSQEDAIDFKSGKSKLITPEQIAIVQPEWDKMQEFLNEGKTEEVDKLKVVRPFFGKGQYEVVKSHLSSYNEVIDDLYETITNMPKTYETDGIKKNDKIAYLHYFTSASDWYIVEKDMETEQLQAFGLVILNGDIEYAELGYISIEELKKYAELDFHFNPKKISEIIDEEIVPEEKPIEILKPLTPETPLDVQLRALTGDGYNWSDYTDEKGDTPTSGGIIVHKETGRRFKAPTNFTYFKGIENNYSNQFNLNKGIEEFLDSKDNDYIFSDQEKSFLYLYEGYGGLEKEGAKGKVLLWEYYTPQLLIKKMWGLANKYGFNQGKVLEPSVGVGRFLDFSEGSNVTAYEINPYSARICKILHPKANVILKSFEEHFYTGNTFNPKFEKDFDLVIGNPPYGDVTGKRSVAESKRLKVAVRKWEHYFILRGLDALKSGGLLIYVSTANLFTKGYEPLKEKIGERAELIDAYLLPNKTFKTTKTNTSLIVLKKK